EILLHFKCPALTDIYTLSLHDALPICRSQLLIGIDQYGNGIVLCCCYAANVIDKAAIAHVLATGADTNDAIGCSDAAACANAQRSEEHTSELQSQSNLVCRLLLAKKKS